MPFGARDWVLVTRFDNRTGEKQFDGILEHVLTYNLSQSSYVNVVPPERVDDDLRLMGKPPTTIVDAAAGPAVALRDAGIRLVVDGEIDRLRAGYAVTVRVVDPHGDTTIARDREEASTTADVSSAMRRVSTWIELTLGETPATVKLENEQAEPVTTRSLVALGDYAEALHAFNIGRFPQADALFGSALSEDPSFPSALIWKAWAEENLGRPRQVYIQSARRAVDLVARATESERYWILGSYYELTDQRQLAIAQYEALTRRFPDNTWALQNLVGLYRVTGRSQDAVDMLVRSANSRAGDFTAQVVAAQAVLTTNGLDAARPSIARAQMLVSSVSDTFKGGSGSAASPFRSWVLAFPAYDLWAQGRGKDAAAALDAASRRSEFDAEGLWALNLLGASRLALGQVRLAEAAFARLTGGQREIAMAELALARNDVPAIIGLLKSYGGYDPVAVSLLVRAGDVRAADQVLRMNRSIHFANETRAGWAADEIAEARGDNRRIMAELENGLPWVRDLHGGARAFLYSETLARAAAVAGNIAGAIRVLEETGASGETAYTPATNNGYYWMRTQKLLADLYREEGQVDKARVVERDLLARLAVADPDYPMLIELKQRAGK